MTTSPTQQTTDTGAGAAGREGGDVTNDDLRDYARRQKDENTVLRGQLLEVHLDKIGLKPGEGLGLAIAENYDGAPTAEAVAEYAKSKYSYEAPKVETPDDPAATQAAEAQKQLENLQSQSNPVVPTNRQDKIAELDAKLAEPDATAQDAKNALAEKLDQYLEDTRHIR